MFVLYQNLLILPQRLLWLSGFLTPDKNNFRHFLEPCLTLLMLPDCWRQQKSPKHRTHHHNSSVYTFFTLHICSFILKTYIHLCSVMFWQLTETEGTKLVGVTPTLRYWFLCSHILLKFTCVCVTQWRAI